MRFLLFVVIFFTLPVFGQSYIGTINSIRKKADIVGKKFDNHPSFYYIDNILLELRYPYSDDNFKSLQLHIKHLEDCALISDQWNNLGPYLVNLSKHISIIELLAKRDQEVSKYANKIDKILLSINISTLEKVLKHQLSGDKYEIYVNHKDILSTSMQLFKKGLNRLTKKGYDKNGLQLFIKGWDKIHSTYTHKIFPLIEDTKTKTTFKKSLSKISLHVSDVIYNIKGKNFKVHKMAREVEVYTVYLEKELQLNNHINPKLQFQMSNIKSTIAEIKIQGNTQVLTKLLGQQIILLENTIKSINNDHLTMIMDKIIKIASNVIVIKN